MVPATDKLFSFTYYTTAALPRDWRVEVAIGPICANKW